MLCLTFYCFANISEITKLVCNPEHKFNKKIPGLFLCLFRLCCLCHALLRINDWYLLLIRRPYLVRVRRKCILKNIWLLFPFRFIVILHCCSWICIIIITRFCKCNSLFSFISSTVLFLTRLSTPGLYNHVIGPAQCSAISTIFYINL